MTTGNISRRYFTQRGTPGRKESDAGTELLSKVMIRILGRGTARPAHAHNSSSARDTSADLSLGSNNRFLGATTK